MKVLFILALSFIQLKAYSASCTDIFEPVIDEISYCRRTIQSDNCAELIDQIDSLSSLKKAHELLGGQNNTRFSKKVKRFVDSNYQNYFLRYVRIINREIPWEEIEKLEKNLSPEQLMASVSDLNHNKCDLLMKRYGLRITWKDIIREALDNHFKSILSQSAYQRRTSDS